MYYFYSTINKMEDFIKKNQGDAKGNTIDDEIPQSIVSKFIQAMDDDFNSALAISNLHIVFRYINNIMKTANKSNRQMIANTLAKALEDIKSVYKILGLFEQNPEDFIHEMKNKYLKKLNLDSKQIESERSNLDEKGIILNDTVDGTVWDIKELYSTNQ